jgi:hypothetical protein
MNRRSLLKTFVALPAVGAKAATPPPQVVEPPILVVTPEALRKAMLQFASSKFAAALWTRLFLQIPTEECSIMHGQYFWRGRCMTHLEVTVAVPDIEAALYVNGLMGTYMLPMANEFADALNRFECCGWAHMPMPDRMEERSSTGIYCETKSGLQFRAFVSDNPRSPLRHFTFDAMVI